MGQIGYWYSSRRHAGNLADSPVPKILKDPKHSKSLLIHCPRSLGGAIIIDMPRGALGCTMRCAGGPGCVRGDSLWHIFTLRENLILQYLTEEWTVYEH